MSIPTWNKMKAINRIAKLLGTNNPKVVVSVEEWARVTGSSRGNVTIDLCDVFDGVEDDYEYSSTEDIILAIKEYYYENGYEYDMEETESFSVDAYDDSDRTVELWSFNIDSVIRSQGYVEDLMNDRIQIENTRGGE